MHYLILAALKIPAKESPHKEWESQNQLTGPGQQAHGGPIEEHSVHDSFSRAVASEAYRILERYSYRTRNPDYLEFCDRTAVVAREYDTGTISCFRLAEGRIVLPMDSRVYGRFTIRDGKVYKCRSGPLQHERRSRQAKRMKALLDYPLKGLFPSLEAFAGEYYGYQHLKGQGKFGYYYNPNAFWDWYSIGGRWPDLFLVKESCPEYFADKDLREQESGRAQAPEGYKWVCAARKKDIEWQAIRDWGLLEAEGRSTSLEKLSTTTATESCPARRSFPDERRYPVSFYGYMDDAACRTEGTFLSDAPGNRTAAEERWQDAVQDYIGSLSDDDVLAGIDCHCRCTFIQHIVLCI